jgi:hypothetical protein
MELTRAVPANRTGERRELERKAQARQWREAAINPSVRCGPTDTQGPAHGRHEPRLSGASR